MKIRYKNRFDKQRRDLLKTMGAAGISPALYRSCALVGGLMMSRVTEAADGPNKSITLLVNGGGLQNKWKPTGGNLNLPVMSREYESVKGEMNFVSGCRNSGGHGVMFQHFGFNFGGDSFDYNMGRTIGANYPLTVLNLGVQTNTKDLTVQGRVGNVQETKLDSIESPAAAISRLKANNVGGGGGNTGGGTAADPRKLFVDVHKEAIDALKRNTKLGTHEQQKLDSHLTAIEELESKLPTGSGGGNPTPTGKTCDVIALPASGGRNEFEKIAFQQIEVAMIALECNLTASVSIAFGEDNHKFTIPTYDKVVHQSHHCCGANSVDYEVSGRYTHGLVARTISRAKEKGILDTTIITQVADMGDASAHGNTNIPLSLAGGGGAIQRRAVTEAGGKHQNDLFQTVSQVLGADQAAGARKFGDVIPGIAT